MSSGKIFREELDETPSSLSLLSLLRQRGISVWEGMRHSVFFMDYFGNCRVGGERKMVTVSTDECLEAA